MTKLKEMYIVLENDKPACIRNAKHDIWRCCIFNFIEEARNYAAVWCGRNIEGMDIDPSDWSNGVDISIMSTPCIIRITTILVPM